MTPTLGFEFRQIRFAYGAKSVLRDVSLTARPGEITCLFGPSGCGKTTLLRLAAGMLNIQDGEIRLNGAVLAAPGTHVPPEKRPVGLVFQEGALFPHLTVARNIGFGVTDPKARSGIVKDLLQQIGLTGRDGAYPHMLSGGQRQRVALARALAPQPSVILLDEPFASIDAVLRRALREETRRLLKARGAIAILVTHDPEEAMEVGDKIAVMAGGAIVQHASPRDLYAAPATADVASLFGGGQRLAAREQGGVLNTPFGPWPLNALRQSLPGRGPVELVARPSDLILCPGDSGAFIEDIRALGSHARIAVRARSGERLAVNLPPDQSPPPGPAVNVLPKAGSLFAFPA
ncbi:MAG: ABC transporter ATP-binding protein [Pseudomonadota bacterium]